MARQQRHAPIEPSLPERARAFLNAANGYDNSKPDCNKRTPFSTLVTTAVDSGIISKHDLVTTFGFSTEQLDRARRGLSTGIASDSRAFFISTVKDKATALIL